MATIHFSNGVTVNFKGNPTQQDIEQVAQEIQSHPARQTQNSPLAATPTQPKQNFLQRAFNGAIGIADKIPGVKTLGNVFGTQAAALMHPDQYDQIISTMPTPEQTIGAGLEAATIPAAAAFAPETVAGAAALGAGTGAAEGAGSAMEQKGNISDVAKSGAIGGTIGAVTGAGLPLAGKALNAIAKQAFENLPLRLIQSALGQSKNELLAGKDVSPYVLQNKRVGTADQLINQSQNAIDELSQKISANLEHKAPKTVRLLKNEILSSVVSKVNADGGAVDAQEVSQIVHDLAPQAKQLLNKKSLSLPEANKLRQSIDKTLGDRAFLMSQLPFRKDILRQFANSLRENVKTLAPAGTRDMFNNLSKEIRLRDALLNKYSGKSRNEVLNAFDLMLSGGGFIGGGPAGALGTLATKKLAQSAIGKTGAAVALDAAGKGFDKVAPILAKLTPAERAVIASFIPSLSGVDGMPPDQLPQESTQFPTQ